MGVVGWNGMLIDFAPSVQYGIFSQADKGGTASDGC